jgi:hypothetical protein|tara:strand:+ start:287 stop:712 length:426 start_codon:yes stop_codon:yes gene_type:complete
MPIATNNNNLGTTIGNLYTGNGMEVQYFTVVVKDSSATAIDLRVHDDSDGKFHKDGLLDRVLQKCQMRGTVVHFNVKNDNSGTVTVGMEGQFGTATNLASEFDNSDGSSNLSVKYRNTASSTTEDGVGDIAGTTVTADTLV